MSNKIQSETSYFVSEHRKKEISGELAPEPMLIDNKDRLKFFPINNKEIWDMYKKAEASFWTAEEIDLYEDNKHLAKLTDNEIFFVKQILAFFASADTIINENLAINFYSEIQISEARCFYGFQIAIENIHSEVYGLLIDSYVKDPIEKEKLFNAINTINSIRKKSDWCFKWFNRDYNSFAERLLAFSIVEGINFSGSFCAIFWLKKRGLMPGLSFANELISKDEGLHTEFACLLYRNLINKLPDVRVYEIINEAVEIECEFIRDAIPVELIGMNSSLMEKYIKFCADRLIISLGYQKLYNIENPFDWMENISLNGKTNFFEKRVSEYSKSGVGVDSEKQQISFTEDF